MSESPLTPLLDVSSLHVHFPIKAGILQRTVGHVKAVDGVSFSIGTGETLGLVGESGCGKTTVGRAILRLIPATSGGVTFGTIDLMKAGPATMKNLRRQMQIIFQDPAGSLNPRMRIEAIVGEPLLVHGLVKPGDRPLLRQKVEELLVRCGMPKHAATGIRTSSQAGSVNGSGSRGALALDPKFIVCDEPTSALDVSIQAQILNLLTDLQRDFGLSFCSSPTTWP